MGGWRFLRGRGHVLQVSIIFVAFLDLVGFETGMHLAMEQQRDGVSPAWRARQNKHRHVVELYEPLQRGDRASFMAQLDAARRLVPFEPPQSPLPPPPRAPVVARWGQETRRRPPPPRRAPRLQSPLWFDAGSATTRSSR